MSRIFGEIRQVALIVRDIDAAVRHWTEVMGVGPFFVARNLCFENYHHRGLPSRSPQISLAVGYSGRLQFEIIQQLNDVPSVYQEFIDAGREGVQHVSAWCSSHEDYDQRRDRALAAGYTLAGEGALICGPDDSWRIRCAYFSTEHAESGLCFELSEAAMAFIEPLNDMARSAAENWDGSVPAR